MSRKVATSKNVKLSKNVTINEYLHFEKTQNRERIAEFIKERFTERYITPLKVDAEKKHGFCTMAICCLMIEAFESF